MFRLGIVGCNYGVSVHLPAFRADGRCEVIGLAGTDLARTKELARSNSIPMACADWVSLVEHGGVEAIAIATPPALQPAVALKALSLGKPVFVEKPLATDLDAASAMVQKAIASRRPTMIDFEFPEIMVWRQAKKMLNDGAIGKLRHVVVTWNVENAATRLRLRNWKTSKSAGGGVLGNFACHCFHYLEWFGGPLRGLSARLFAMPDIDADEETTVASAFVFLSGAAGSLQVSCASYSGSGHRLEFYGDDGTLMLVNTGADYVRGFQLLYGQRPAALAPVPVDDELDRRFADGRIAPVARLAARFVDAVEAGGDPIVPVPGFAEGYRVQKLMAAAQRSHQTGRWIDLGSEART